MTLLLFYLQIGEPLHQTTTLLRTFARTIALYFILFLHQTTTRDSCDVFELCCISFYFYIKPQLFAPWNNYSTVVFHSISTSSHNHAWHTFLGSNVVFHSISTSSHNVIVPNVSKLSVVFHSISTSSHNQLEAVIKSAKVVFHSISTSSHNLL